MGIRDKPIAPASPWQNGFVERLIGSIRRECVDHIIVLSEAHLAPLVGNYNETPTHLASDKDARLSRPVQRTGAVRSLGILGGLHHHYARA
jgi:transposase InsO family protein